MSGYRVDLQAARDLDEIFDYIARDNHSAAIGLIRKIQGKFELLASHPLLGELRPDLAHDLRCFAVGNFVIFYRPHDTGIDVVRVIHGARDINAQFEGGSP